MNLYICPKCKEKLNLIDKSYKCINNHCYDISKKGYLNLLLTFDKSSKNPGDAKECLEARNNFFKKNYYQCILNNIIKFIHKYKNGKINILDIGCGEGYYTSGIKKEFEDSNVYGFDISKDGINFACNYTKEVNWFVANSKNIPIESNSIDVILAAFSFTTFEEIKRVLKKDGIVIQVCALDNHLIELKEKLYDDVKIKKIENKLLPFEILEQQRIVDKIKITSNDDIKNLFKMTPHYYRVKKEKRTIIDGIKNIDITIDIIINVYKIS